MVGNVVLIRNHESGMNKLGECKYNKLSCPAIYSTEEELDYKAWRFDENREKWLDG